MIKCIYMVWIILTAIVITFLVIAIIVGIVISSKQGRGDYGDGGGTHIGTSHTTSFFAPEHEKAGAFGESFANSNLNHLLRKDEYLLSNLLLPLRKGGNVEIDTIIISRKGLFCIEIKNWSGNVFGSEEMDKWMQRYNNPEKPDRYHLNPVKQNSFHCKILKGTLKNKYSPANVVLFVNRETYLYVNSKHAYHLHSFVDAYRNLPDDCFDKSAIDEMFRELLPYVATKEQLDKHREETKRRFN